MTNSNSRRRALTLLEVVLALAIFSGSMVALGQLAWSGTQAAVQARLNTQATIRCEAKLNEILAGAEGMRSVSGMAFPDDSSWTWSQVVTSSNYPELVQIDLMVNHKGTSRLGNVSISLRRWARTQSLFVKAVTQEKQEEDEKASSK